MENTDKMLSFKDPKWFTDQGGLGFSIVAEGVLIWKP